MNSEKSLSLHSVFTARSHRLMVRSPPFQGGSTGSNPVGITSRHRFTMPFFLFIPFLGTCIAWKTCTQNILGAAFETGKRAIRIYHIHQHIRVDDTYY